MEVGGATRAKSPPSNPSQEILERAPGSGGMRCVVGEACRPMPPPIQASAAPHTWLTNLVN